LIFFTTTDLFNFLTTIELQISLFNFILAKKFACKLCVFFKRLPQNSHQFVLQFALQINLELKVCGGSSIRKTLVKEAAACGAAHLILGVANNSRSFGYII